MFDTGYRMLGAGAQGWSREMIWDGRWEGGSGLGTHVHPWLIHVNVWQNQYSIVKQNKVKIKIKKNKSYTVLVKKYEGHKQSSWNGVRMNTAAWPAWPAIIQPHWTYFLDLKTRKDGNSSLNRTFLNVRFFFLFLAKVKRGLRKVVCTSCPPV